MHANTAIAYLCRRALLPASSIHNLSIQYCMEENSSSVEVSGKKKKVHVDLKYIIWGKKSVNKGPTRLQLPHTAPTYYIAVPSWV